MFSYRLLSISTLHLSCKTGEKQNIKYTGVKLSPTLCEKSMDLNT